MRYHFVNQQDSNAKPHFSTPERSSELTSHSVDYGTVASYVYVTISFVIIRTSILGKYLSLGDLTDHTIRSLEYLIHYEKVPPMKV